MCLDGKVAMENNNKLILPDKLSIQNFNNVEDLIEAAYEVFKRDFIYKRPSFRGVRLGLKQYPQRDGKEATFYHMTTEGDIEDERAPDIERLERIMWTAPMINNSDHPELKVWENIRGGKCNILIFHEVEGYLIVLRKANGYLLPWTAYYVKYRNQKEKLLREYNTYKVQNPPNRS